MTKKIIATCVDEDGNTGEVSVQVRGRGIGSPLLPDINEGVRLMLMGAKAGRIRVMHVRETEPPTPKRKL